ncbi:MAG: hypothetical protein ACO3AC_13060 [Hylemonella sp.]
MNTDVFGAERVLDSVMAGQELAGLMKNTEAFDAQPAVDAVMASQEEGGLVNMEADKLAKILRKSHSYKSSLNDQFDLAQMTMEQPARTKIYQQYPPTIARRAV